MAGLAPHPANFFKFLLILVLYTICMTLFVCNASTVRPFAFFTHVACSSYARRISSVKTNETMQNFLLGSAIADGGLALLLSALSGLYQMTFAGFFVHLNAIPQVLRWLQWLCPLKYALEALAVNEVNSGLQIKDVLQGVPVSVSAALIMNLVRAFLGFPSSPPAEFAMRRVGFSSCSDSTQVIITVTCSCCSHSSLVLASASSPWCGSGCGRPDERYLR